MNMMRQCLTTMTTTTLNKNTNVNRPFCAEENDQCLKCKPIIEKLKQEIKELRSSQMPGGLPYLVMFL